MAQAAACTPVPLRDALDQIASEAGVRLSYSRELIAIDRPVCPPLTRQPALTALDSLLRGTGVEAISVGGGQIVLAPAAHTTGEASGAPSRPTVLDRVVVTGNPAGAPSRALPVALSVVDGSALGPRASVSLATALDGTVPGLWLWAQPTTTLLSRYAGLRGASSFGLTTPKLYIDGVEVANPLFVTSLTPDQIDRVEVIRGPQGAALYGADAISGVINVITRHDGAENGRALTFRSGVGAAATAFAAGPAFAQDHGLTLRTGAGASTGGVSVGLRALGPVIPGSTAHQFTAIGDLRRVGPSGVFTLLARVSDAVAPPDTGVFAAIGVPRNTATPAMLPTQHVSELTLALNGVRTAGGRWTQTVTAGLDAYRLTGVSTTDIAALSPQLDSTQRTARGGAARGTLRATTTATYDPARDLALTVTGIADYGLLRDGTRLDDPGSAVQRATPLGLTDRDDSRWRTHGPGYAPLTPVSWLGTAGLVGQTTLAWRNAVFVTAGLRGERNDGFTVDGRAALLPSLGVSAVHTFDGATLKLRTAYGRGLRPVRSATRQIAWHAAGGGELPGSLAPESQTGIEGGVDLFMGQTAGAGKAGSTLALHLTGYSQLAAGLVQQVALAPDAPGILEGRAIAPAGLTRWHNEAHDADLGHVDYALQNVGAISNRGVEAEAQLRAPSGRTGGFTLGTTVAYVDSRIRRTADGYTGELRAGDRVLEVPRWTLGATAGWQTPGWSTTLGVARAADWVNYDRLALAAAVTSGGRSYATFAGPSLRAFWRTYPGVTRLRADVTRDLSRGLAIVLTGDNLLDRQRGEPDNVTVLPGRTLTAGVRAHF